MRLVSLVAAAALALAACSDGDTGSGPATDEGGAGNTGGDVGGEVDDAGGEDAGPDATDPPPEPDQVFVFGTEPSQTLSAAPFPNDLYLGDAGIALAPLGDDPIMGVSAKPEVLATWDATIAGTKGFNALGGAWFFVRGEVDIDSFEGRVRMVSTAGQDAGREVSAEAFWAPHFDAVGVKFAFGEWLLPGSQYAVLIETGPTMADGTPIEAPVEFAETIAADGGASPVRDAFAPLRDTLADKGWTAADFIIGTVFTTEDARPVARRALDTVDAFALPPVTKNYLYDAEGEAWLEAPVIEGADLDLYFGVPTAPQQHNPGIWYEDGRVLAGGGARYEGGSFRGKIGRVYNGTLRVPSMNRQIGAEDAVVSAPLSPDGDLFEVRAELTNPFTLYLCESHLADPSNLPVAIFQHGGGATRADAKPFATLNCELGIATIAAELPYHGARAKLIPVEGGSLFAAASPDTANAFTGLSEGEPGYFPDYISDSIGAVGNVAPFFGIGDDFAPEIVSANLLTVSTDNYAVVRHLKEGDWSALDPNLSFDPGHIFHASLSFGTSFTTALIALRDDFRGVITSVGAGQLTAQTLPMSPSNAGQASGLLGIVVGLPSSPEELRAGAWTDLSLYMLQWLGQAGDPLTWAPYVLRYRESGKAMSVVSTGNSWDATLHAGSQMSYANAYGLQSFTAGPKWTIDPSSPGAASLAATPADPAGVAGNVSFGGVDHTAASYFWAESCHAGAVTAYCSRGFELTYPPIEALDETVGAPSPICEAHHAWKAFLQSLLDGDAHGLAIPPGSDCAGVYSD